MWELGRGGICEVWCLRSREVSHAYRPGVGVAFLLEGLGSTLRLMGPQTERRLRTQGPN